MKILAAAIGRLANADAAGPAENAIDLRDQPFRLIEVMRLPEVGIQGGEQYSPKASVQR
jgi:hypothetical protein